MDREDLDEEGGSGDAGLDLRHYWAVVKKRRWIIIATVIVVASAVIVAANRTPRVYQAAATVILEPQAPNVMGGETVEVQQLGQGNSYWDATEYFNTQQRILTSRSLARQVVVKYQLHKDPRLAGPITGGKTEDQAIDETTSEFQGRIGVALLKESRVLAISVRDGDPALARDLANRVADVYIEQNLAVKHDVTRLARGWVARQLDDARAELDKSENSLYSFKKDNNILSVSLEDQRNIVSRDLESFSTALTETKKKRIELQARRNAIGGLVDADSAAAPSNYFTPSPAIEQLRASYLEERRKLPVLEERYGPKHPDVVAQRARVQSAFQDLKGEVDSLLKSMDGELRAQEAAEAKLRAEVERLTREAFDLNKREIEYKRLSRDATNSDEIYSMLLKRLNESSLEERDYSNNIRLLDEARVPMAPVEPDMRRATAMGLGLGLLLAFGLAFLAEFLDRSVKSQEDLEKTIGLPFLGMVPSVVGKIDAGSTPELYIAREPTSTVAECCRVVRTNILFCSPDKPLKRLVVTSSNPVEGKTLTVAQLGITMAQNGHRTLLVDTDMRRPRLHKALGVHNDNGISRLVVGETDIDSAVKTTEVPNLFVLPCGPIPPNPSELLQTERFAAVVEALGQRFDRVIFDTPPILAVTDAVVLSRIMDGCVLVVRAGRTTRDAVMRAKRLLNNVGAPITGAVLNDVDLKNPQYASYYQYEQYKYQEPVAVGATAKKA